MIKLTSKRKKVYEIFETSNKPINAFDIHNTIGSESINLSTVYRAIDFLLDNNLLISFHFNSKTYYILNDDNNHYHYFICTSCLHMEKINCNMNNVIKDLEVNLNYQVMNHEMTLYGLCNNCII